MKVKTMVITVALLGIAVVVAAYIQRGEWAVGAEWAIPVIAAMIIPIKDEVKAGRRESKHEENF